MLVITLAGELLLRFHPKYGRAGYVYDAHTIYRLNPNLAAQKWYAMNKVPNKGPFTLRFNNRGFRGADMVLKKPKDKVRIMVLGDSYTAGLDYPDEEIFTAQLAAKLRATSDEYEVINVSCPAWGTDQEWRYWETEGKYYQPDYLLLMCSPNDIRESYNKGLVRLENGDLIAQKADLFSKKQRWGWKLANKSSLFQYLQKKVFKTKYGDFLTLFHTYPVNYGIRDSTDWDAPMYLREPFKEVNESFTLNARLLAELKKSTAAVGTKLLVAKIPAVHEFNGSYESEEFRPNTISEYLDSTAANLNIPLLNMDHNLAKDADPKHIFMSWEFHFNKAGHDWVAEQLHPFFLQHK